MHFQHAIIFHVKWDIFWRLRHVVPIDPTALLIFSRADTAGKGMHIFYMSY